MKIIFTLLKEKVITMKTFIIKVRLMRDIYIQPKRYLSSALVTMSVKRMVM